MPATRIEGDDGMHSLYDSVGCRFAIRCIRDVKRFFASHTIICIAGAETRRAELVVLARKYFERGVNRKFSSKLTIFQNFRMSKEKTQVCL